MWGNFAQSRLLFCAVFQRPARGSRLVALLPLTRLNLVRANLGFARLILLTPRGQLPLVQDLNLLGWNPMKLE